MGRWYVIRTESRAEYLAANELENEGFRIFSPGYALPIPEADTMTFHCSPVIYS